MTVLTVTDWLLDSDPAIRWQVMRDLTDAPAEEVAAERAKVATEGWGAQLLAMQRPDAQWTAEPNRKPTGDEWFANLEAFILLRDLGLDPASEEARRAMSVVRDDEVWQAALRPYYAWYGRPFFAGETEPCINGRVVTIGAYFGEDVQVVVDRLLTEQMDDGGWNCEQENGSTRGSFDSTMNVIEGLLEYERAVGGNADVTAARIRGQEYLLDRRLFRRLSTGELISKPSTADWLRISFPTGYHYDLLRALDYLRGAGVQPDERTAEALALLEQKRDAVGRWPLEQRHDSELNFDMGEREGAPSRWITLRALRVLRWAGRT